VLKHNSFARALLISYISHNLTILGFRLYMELISKAVVLLSGGIDSTTVLAIAKLEGFEVYAISFRYGQRHQIELTNADLIAKSFCVKDHIVLDIDLRPFGGSALTSNIAVPKERSSLEMSSGIPATYVPARNTVFLSLSLAWAEVIGADHIFLGVNALDYSGYPDCRTEFIEAFETMANLATKASVEGGRKIKIHTPLIKLTKAEIIKKGLSLGLNYAMTSSCYDPSLNGSPCGKCDSCQLRLKGFADAGETDPLNY
jgi:7-cyano-7-deazaguanine synthase